MWTNKQTQTDVDDRLTHATTVDMSNYQNLILPAVKPTGV